MFRHPKHRVIFRYTLALGQREHINENILIAIPDLDVIRFDYFNFNIFLFYTVAGHFSEPENVSNEPSIFPTS